MMLWKRLINIEDIERDDHNKILDKGATQETLMRIIVKKISSDRQSKSKYCHPTLLPT